MGPARIRAGQRKAALADLATAARLAPANAHYAFVHAVALYGLDRRKQAIRSLETALQAHPTNRDILFTLIQHHLESGDPERAKTLAERFRRNWPDDPRSRQLAAPPTQPAENHATR